MSMIIILPDGESKWVKGGDIHIKTNGVLEIGENSTLVFEMGHAIKLEGGYITISDNNAQIVKRLLPNYECARGQDCASGKYCRGSDFTCQDLPGPCKVRNEDTTGYTSAPDYTQCSSVPCDLCFGGSCVEKRGTSMTINGDVVYCDRRGRMWSTTQTRANGVVTPDFQWRSYGTDLPNDSCIGVYHQYSACTHCDELTYAGFSDWILPPCESSDNCLLRELGLDLCGGFPCDGSQYDSSFAIAGVYWSSTEISANCARGVSFYDGSIGSLSKLDSDRVRCVRVGSSPCEGKADGTSCGDNMVCQGGKCVEQACYGKADGEQCGLTVCDMCDSGYCVKKRREFFTLNGDQVYCDKEGRMWSPSIKGASYNDSLREWGPLGESPPNNKCIGQGPNYPACDYCDNLNYAGFSDWFLPDRNDLCGLGKSFCSWTSCDGNQSDCTLYPFPIDYYDFGTFWSSEDQSQNNAWYVDFTNGKINFISKSQRFGVRCVRKNICTGQPDGTPCGECKECQSGQCVAVSDGTPCGNPQDCKVCQGGECTGQAPDGTRCWTGDWGECTGCSYSGICDETGYGGVRSRTYKTCVGGVCSQEHTETSSCDSCPRNTDGLCCGYHQECQDGVCQEEKGKYVWVDSGTGVDNCEDACSSPISFGFCGCKETDNVKFLCYANSDCTGVNWEREAFSFGCSATFPIGVCFNCPGGSACPTACQQIGGVDSFQYTGFGCRCYHCCSFLTLFLHCLDKFSIGSF